MKLTIGFGKSVTRYHLPFLLGRDHLKVKMIYSRTKKEDLENTYKPQGIEFSNELFVLLNGPDIQLISICTAHNSHCPSYWPPVKTYASSIKKAR